MLRFSLLTTTVTLLLSAVSGQGTTGTATTTPTVSDGRDPKLLNLHGSGTTNPSKCYWYILDLLAGGSKTPLHMTYRAVGSTAGQDEFFNDLNPTEGLNDYASGDLPLSTEQYDALRAAGINVFQFPVLLGTVSVFANVDLTPKIQADPDDPLDQNAVASARLSLSPCVLAKIFTNEITTWDNEEIADLNPDISLSGPISVNVRSQGSSSTWALTNYLRIACPEVFPAALADDFPDWPYDNFARCDGSGGMVSCLQSTHGSIGYAESGHGHAAGIPEVALKNDAGTVLNSIEANERGGISTAETNAFPAEADANFGNVNLLNRPGINTWPMVTMTYVYVRKNLSFLGDPEEQALLIAFLRALQQEEIVGHCRDEYDFVLPSQAVADMASKGIDLLEEVVKNDNYWNNRTYTPWTFEWDTQPMAGQGNYVISSKRRTIAEVERSDLMSRISNLEAEIEVLTASIDQQAAAAVQKEQQLASQAQYTAQKDSQLKASLVLSSLSFCFCTLYFLYCVSGAVTKA